MEKRLVAENFRINGTSQFVNVLNRNDGSNLSHVYQGLISGDSDLSILELFTPFQIIPSIISNQNRVV